MPGGTKRSTHEVPSTRRRPELAINMSPLPIASATAYSDAGLYTPNPLRQSRYVRAPAHDFAALLQRPQLNGSVWCHPPAPQRASPGPAEYNPRAHSRGGHFDMYQGTRGQAHRPLSSRGISSHGLLPPPQHALCMRQIGDSSWVPMPANAPTPQCWSGREAALVKSHQRLMAAQQYAAATELERRSRSRPTSSSPHALLSKRCTHPPPSMCYWIPKTHWAVDSAIRPPSTGWHGVPSPKS